MSGAARFTSEDKAFWRCFGCGAHGGCFKWVMETKAADDFREAVEYRAHEIGHGRPDHNSMSGGSLRM